jgi:hypothetical protein
MSSAFWSPERYSLGVSDDVAGMPRPRTEGAIVENCLSFRSWVYKRWKEIKRGGNERKYPKENGGDLEMAID